MINRVASVSVPCIGTSVETYGVSAVVTTGAAINILGADVNGQIIDRLGIGGVAGMPGVILKNMRPLAASPFALIWSTMGTTVADMKAVISCRLQHGDSSGGGDMADLSTQQQAASRTYFSSAMSSEYATWTAGFATATPRYFSNPAEYTLDAAKRYLRPVSNLTKAGATTVATDVYSLIQGITFKEFSHSYPLNLTGTTASSS